MSWQKLVGHENVLTQLRHALLRGRLGHGFLFVGPSGIGKRRVAQHIAQGLLCEVNHANGLDPCGKCAGCLQVESGAHPDFFQIAKPEGKHELSIDVVQNLCSELSMKPARGRGKVAIIDDADVMNVEAANCFLKTLEEPPPGCVLFLIASSLESQLATIISRCQVVRFQDLLAEQVADLLIATGAQTNPEIAKGIAALAGGSIGRAMMWSDEEYQQVRGEFLNGFAKLPAASVMLAQEIQKFIESAGKESVLKRGRARDVIALAADLYREALRNKQGVQTARGSASEAYASQSLAQRLPDDILLDMLDRCVEADRHINRFLSQSISIDCWIDDLAQLAAGHVF